MKSTTTQKKVPAITKYWTYARRSQSRKRQKRRPKTDRRRTMTPYNNGTVCCMVTHIARVWINRVRLPILHGVSWIGKMNVSLSPFAPENLVSRDGFGSSSVPRQSDVYVISVTAGKCNWRHFGWSVRLVGFPQCYLTCRFLTNNIFYLIQVWVVFQNEKEEG